MSPIRSPCWSWSAPTAAGRRRRVDAAVPVSGTLRDLAFAEADAAAARLRGALAPFAVIPQLLNQIAGIVGLQGAIGQGLSGVILAVLDSAPPARIAAMLTPVYVALRGRLEDLLASVLDPLRAGIDNVIAVLEAIDIGDCRTSSTPSMPPRAARSRRSSPRRSWPSRSPTSPRCRPRSPPRSDRRAGGCDQGGGERDAGAGEHRPGEAGGSRRRRSSTTSSARWSSSTSASCWSRSSCSSTPSRSRSTPDWRAPVPRSSGCRTRCRTRSARRR